MSVLVYVEEPGDLAEQALTFARGLDAQVHAFCTGEEPALSGVETVHVAE